MLYHTPTDVLTTSMTADYLDVGAVTNAPAFFYRVASPVAADVRRL